jgi:hypothetical protein
MNKIILFPQGPGLPLGKSTTPEAIPTDTADPMWVFNSFMQELEANGIMDELRALPPRKRRLRNLARQEDQ